MKFNHDWSIKLKVFCQLHVIFLSELICQNEKATQKKDLQMYNQSYKQRINLHVIETILIDIIVESDPKSISKLKSANNKTGWPNAVRDSLPIMRSLVRIPWPAIVWPSVRSHGTLAKILPWVLARVPWLRTVGGVFN